MSKSPAPVIVTLASFSLWFAIVPNGGNLEIGAGASSPRPLQRLRTQWMTVAARASSAVTTSAASVIEPISRRMIATHDLALLLGSGSRADRLRVLEPARVQHHRAPPRA